MADWQTSQGKTRDLHPIYPPHLLPHLPNGYRASGLVAPRPSASASYAVSVRRAGSLPAASFRSRVAPDTLAVQLTVPAIRARRGLQPPSPQSTTTVDQVALSRHAPCLAYNVRGDRRSPLQSITIADLLNKLLTFHKINCSVKQHVKIILLLKGFTPS